MRLAMLQFERKLQKSNRMGIAIFKIFIWGGISSDKWLERGISSDMWSERGIYYRIYGGKSRLTAPLTCPRKTKFPIVYPMIFLPK